MGKEKSSDLMMEADKDIAIEAGAARLKQVLNNLLSNALRYIPEGGHVIVKAGL